MKSNTQILGAIAIGAGAWLLVRLVQQVMCHQQHAARKLDKKNVQSWEEEGGAIHDGRPRSTTAI